MIPVTRRLSLQIMAATAAAPASATTTLLANPDAELIELGTRFVEISRLADAASDETGRLYEIARRSYLPGTYVEACLRGTVARDAYLAARDAADEQSGLMAAEDAFNDAMDQLRATFARMVTMRPTTIEGMRAIALAVLHFEWGGNVEHREGAIEGAALAVLVAGLLDKPIPGDLTEWAAAWI
ncbi:hypothetical protein ACVIHI_002653 [Bradyrhizobium sp. USDA 4524]|uniref:hypothetical protein n=1 Tax=unclassified Bradyrhizobium TaxID=2631580 RepID=UPI0020A19E46|nr:MULTISPECIES: hypothetical protein [unclassified Bradyrhizobium]MCP1844426.1 hypothetical protein [Bradyrhizobium sp. USDA 4538]MCP1904992.1 hypothetical protein [Bradyrhizobium sp. USDA 4537]MCP1989352.1 hypothetical protein [Bradyrhizobium sp. USDA 4539]